MTPTVRQALAQSGLVPVDASVLLAHVAGRDRAWLRKIRPWYLHDDHLHVRLSCPPGLAGCVAQDPVPEGDGCDEGLERWVEEIRTAALNPKPQRPSPPRAAAAMPGACDAVLAGRPAPSLGVAEPRLRPRGR